MNTTVLSVYSIFKLAIAMWLFSHTLPHRDHFAARVTGAAVLLATTIGLVGALGFSVFPTLTDDLSFFSAILMFVSVLVFLVAVQLCLFRCSLWTSLFCCSMAYLLENLSSSVERAVVILVSADGSALSLVESSLRHWLFAAVVYAACYLLLIRKIEKSGLLQISQPVMVVTAALVVLVNMVLDLVIKDVAMFEVPMRYPVILSWAYVLLCIYLMYSSFEIVYTRRLRMNMAALERLRAAEARQYQMSRENIEAINLKFHDIKHQIRKLSSGGAAVDGSVLADLSRGVDIYDSAVRTGNDALDTILTEKSLTCQRRGITLSCIADGEALGFVEPVELYSLFGNALDNAIEAVERLDDPERRSIGLVVRRAGDMVSIHVENYFDGNVRFDEDGLPVTRKGDQLNHGFGVRSMRMIVEGLGGSLSVGAHDDIFHVDALVPLP